MEDTSRVLPMRRTVFFFSYFPSSLFTQFPFTTGDADVKYGLCVNLSATFARGLQLQSVVAITSNAQYFKCVTVIASYNMIIKLLGRIFDGSMIKVLLLLSAIIRVVVVSSVLTAIEADNGATLSQLWTVRCTITADVERIFHMVLNTAEPRVTTV